MVKAGMEARPIVSSTVWYLLQLPINIFSYILELLVESFEPLMSPLFPKLIKKEGERWDVLKTKVNHVGHPRLKEEAAEKFSATYFAVINNLILKFM